MAQRYGGKHSPKGSPDNARAGLEQPINKFRGRKAHNSNIRAKLLFFVPFPLLFAGIGELRAGDVLGMLAELGAFALLILSAWLLRSGIEAQEAYDARKVARPPAIPRKTFSAILTGIGIFLAASLGWGLDIFQSIVLSAIASVAQFISFGPDPRQKKGMEGLSEFELQRVAEAVDKAEGLLAETIAASKRFADRKLEGRVEELAARAREMFRAVEEDPRDLSSARKFMGVYLKGARDATVKFADLYTKKRDAKARADYEALLTDLEASFASKKEILLMENRTDLDVEIEVLRDRLKQEGLRAKV
jgi:5-bromo-4-chloroindolyl phosphate hydrolysis protein